MASKPIESTSGKIPKKWAALARDVDALASYQPRAEAIEALLAGRFEQALDWLERDCFEAAHGKPRPAALGRIGRVKLLTDPLELDRVLFVERVHTLDERKFAVKRALGSVPRFLMPPMEIILREGSDEVFQAAIDMASAPEIRKLSGDQGIVMHMDSLEAWESLDPMGELSERYRWRGHQLVALAAMKGKINQAEAMLKAGFFGFNDDSQGLANMFRDAAKISQAQLQDAFDVEDAQAVEKGRDWFAEKLDLSSRIDDFVTEQNRLEAGSGAEQAKKAETASKIKALLAQGCQPSAYCMAWATTHDEIELLREMFAAGGDPNALANSGVPILARMESERVSASALQVWLDAGANPAMSPNGLFGDGMCPSALYEWAWEGKLDLARQAVDHARGPVPVVVEVEGALSSPLLAVALSEGRVDVARWLIEEQGCRLDHLAYLGGDAQCHEMATPELLNMARAWEERITLEGCVDHRLPGDRGPRPGPL